MKFTRDMLKLLHQYRYLGNIDYYLLTNNLYNIEQYLNEEIGRRHDDGTALIVADWKQKINSFEMLKKICNMEIKRANILKSIKLKDLISKEINSFQTKVNDKNTILLLGPKVKLLKSFTF
jgi:hypothetical protein